MMLWLELLLCLAVIGYAGYFLSCYGDILAEKTGLSASWIGLILLATATSLLAAVSPSHALTALTAVMMSALVINLPSTAARGVGTHLGEPGPVPVVYPQHLGSFPTWTMK